MKLMYRIGADSIFILHFVLVVFILFGWLFETLRYVYIGVLVATLLSDVVYGYCLISKWEFLLRKKINPNLEYRYTWTTFYTRGITKRVAVFFLASMLLLNIYFGFIQG